METSETRNSPPPLPVAGDPTENPTATTPSVPSAKPSSAEVLITEQQVIFGTAAAAASRPENRLMAALGWVFATSTTEIHSRRHHSVQRRMYYIECARMGREMGRL